MILDIMEIAGAMAPVRWNGGVTVIARSGRAPVPPAGDVPDVLRQFVELAALVHEGRHNEGAAADAALARAEGVLFAVVGRLAEKAGLQPEAIPDLAQRLPHDWRELAQ